MSTTNKERGTASETRCVLILVSNGRARENDVIIIARMTSSHLLERLLPHLLERPRVTRQQGHPVLDAPRSAYVQSTSLPQSQKRNLLVKELRAYARSVRLHVALRR